MAFGVEEDEVDTEQVKKVAEIAQLDAFVDTLPQGFDTVIGEGGVRLSGGQSNALGLPGLYIMNPKYSSWMRRLRRLTTEQKSSSWRP